jgi:hypothetical protein
MQLTLIHTPVESELSTPSDIFDLTPPAEQPQAPWSTVQYFAMAEQNYSEHLGRLSAPSQDWTPASAVCAPPIEKEARVSS